MSYIKFEPGPDMDLRKDQLRKILTTLPGTECVAPQDKMIIVDLIVSGVQKAMDAITTHVDASAPVLRNPQAIVLLGALTLAELSNAAERMAEQCMDAFASIAMTPEELGAAIKRMAATMGEAE